MVPPELSFAPPPLVPPAPDRVPPAAELPSELAPEQACETAQSAHTATTLGGRSMQRRAKCFMARSISYSRQPWRFMGAQEAILSGMLVPAYERTVGGSVVVAAIRQNASTTRKPLCEWRGHLRSRNHIGNGIQRTTSGETWWPPQGASRHELNCRCYAEVVGRPQTFGSARSHGIRPDDAHVVGTKATAGQHEIDSLCRG